MKTMSIVMLVSYLFLVSCAPPLVKASSDMATEVPKRIEGLTVTTDVDFEVDAGQFATVRVAIYRSEEDGTEAQFIQDVGTAYKWAALKCPGESYFYEGTCLVEVWLLVPMYDVPTVKGGLVDVFVTATILRLTRDQVNTLPIEDLVNSRELVNYHLAVNPKAFENICQFKLFLGFK